MVNIGLARGTVKLAAYDALWPQQYNTEAMLIQEITGTPPDSIEHVGSTSIPGMVAKPIIDIAVLVDSLDRAEAWQSKLASIGYWYKGAQPDMPDRRFFAKGPETMRTVYLHLANKDEFERLVRFRDYLISNKSVAAEYAKLKQELAASNADNRASYSKLKNDFIQTVLKN